ncbi:mitochondrial inner membrane translocase subunit TIM17, putative [Toxoplasma gondii ME49]|uniref:Mitochondrial import inner membrane translocase subunit TIM17, putative n=10 Tax=Toxoplasma gondii TaxID=5811 RepID=A0A125YQ03_TOXGV|nr:mitochondrial inner membrane translocase subunit TIM17, putative [Toxoplasma gondii ME49]EPT26032.1 mitochondrial inner membrane translocase subunit TIM17, putative [Toxoplasma gondii ME49]ESS35057.1 putative mitochondrial inner membrane translocase subunit TIM17 [Toxoplasma gondii VEG]KYF48074.1 putative mitochondrial import inner membrane translocase subunit TIM17 [Toxoplasma gondii ARI]CEL77483.1 TPA: mitochondrial import inner membrane translocase subunit TIM17, putative [Toxoplasma gond|eukprot:XP_002364444.1 mitochondrial inner membrane translocase subunit TIM17, putative [Toxoplasma gondii ME49]
MPPRHDLTREPCPGRILEDLGGAFGMGALGGFLWHFAKGWRNSPKYEKFAGGMLSGSMKSPLVGSSFAVWGGLYATFDCSLIYLRGGKEDSWNPVLSGALTGGVLSMRSGWRSCMKNAAIGGVLLGIIEVVQLAFQRSTGEGPTPRQQYRQYLEMEQAERRAAEQAGSSPSFFKRFFSSGGPPGNSNSGSSSSPGSSSGGSEFLPEKPEGVSV